MSKLLVIMPLYNRGKFVEEAIESVLQQTHQNFELVIIDDCSTDNSFKIAKSYESHPKVTILQNKENMGCYYSRNRGLDYFKDKEWDYFTIHDPDDASDINRFEIILKKFTHDKILGIKSTYIEADKNLNPILINNRTTYQSEGIAFYNRQTFNILGYFHNTRFSGDTDYWWRLITYCGINPGYGITISYEPLYIRRHHGDNLTHIYDFDTTRPQYFDKVRNEIETVMAPNNNFYREIFK